MACVLVAHPVCGQVTTSLQVVNKFKSGASYFGNTYTDDQVWLYFINTGSAVTYTNTSGSSVAVADATPVQLSSVNNRTFSVGVGSASTRVWAALGATNPFTVGQPQQFQPNIPYALAEWTVNGNSYDNIDVSYQDSFSFPTVLRVVNSSGTSIAGFPAGTQAATVVSALSAALPAPVGPSGTANPNYPSASANGGLGWSPVSTVTGNAQAVRNIGSSKYQVMGPDTNGNFTMYQYIPSFNEYLGYLQAHTPNTVVGSGTTNTINGFWTDLTIASGASLINGDFASGPVVVGTGDFSVSGTHSAINPTFLASISASIATGLLGSGTYMNGMWADPSAGTLVADPGGTMRWFQTLTREQSTQVLFDKAWGTGQQFYDPYWATLADLSGMQGYLSPFNDRWANFSPDFTLDSTAGSNTVTWELGLVAVPEPSSAVIAVMGCAGGAWAGWRRRQRRRRHQARPVSGPSPQ